MSLGLFNIGSTIRPWSFASNLKPKPAWNVGIHITDLDHPMDDPLQCSLSTAKEPLPSAGVERAHGNPGIDKEID